MKGFCILIAAAALAGCTVVPAGMARQACDLIQVASDELDDSRAAYAGMVKKADGHAADVRTFSETWPVITTRGKETP